MFSLLRRWFKTSTQQPPLPRKAVCSKPKEKRDYNQQEQQLYDMLMAIYPAQKPFAIHISSCRHQRWLGCYRSGRKQIILYGPRLQNQNTMRDVAIHEYAHHLQFSLGYYRRRHPHDEHFWQIYTILRLRADRLGYLSSCDLPIQL